MKKKNSKTKNKFALASLFALILIILTIIVYAADTQTTATRQDAIIAIQKAQLDIDEMIASELPTQAANDTLLQANQSLQRADFAQLIRTNSTSPLAEQAKKALEGLNYNGFTYNDVIEKTNQVIEIKQQAYAILDEIRAVEIKKEEYKKQQGIDVLNAEVFLQQAKDAFMKERYTETQNFLQQANNDLDTKKAEQTTLQAIVISSTSFVKKNWLWLIVSAMILAVIIFFVWKKIRRKLIKKQIAKLTAEQQALQKLMEKAQEERFREGTLPSAIYNVRMSLYNKRMDEAKEKIPVLEAMLKNET